MPEAEVLYNIKSKRPRGNTDVAPPSTDDHTYCNIDNLKAQRPGSKQPAASNRRSGGTSEKVALLLLSVLLAAAVTALGVTLHENTQTKKSLHKLQEEATNLTDEACPRCNDGWEPHGGQSYFFSSVNLTWNESRTQCKSMGGDLVVINNREEQRFLESRLKVKMDFYEDRFWIGLTDSQNESEWLWVDDTRLNSSWQSWVYHEPDNWTEEDPDGENCVRMGKEDLVSWADKSCKSPQKSICEKPQAWA
ncbi:hepatic lectin isoform X2 [Pleuronectes platessa]|uniref:hepatic lectin isoform X2 n=1 Tax=Pleuronectes platessa TaxID=8262 RepID=UPI00232A69DA|nr:hepatic lectin isoform X2 [Pleuronectes platessa]